MIIVPDTNVYVAGTATASSTPSSQIMKLWHEGLYDIAVSEPILEEITRVFTTYPQVSKLIAKNGITPTQFMSYIKDIRSAATVVPGTTPVNISPDPTDNMFFSCAVEAGADYIVSKDKNHVLSVGSYKGIQTIAPHDFIENVIKIRKAA